MPLDMGSQAVNSGPIPGLQMILTEDHLKHSRDIRNNLSKESKDETAEHIDFLLGLLKDCGVQDILESLMFTVILTSSWFPYGYGNRGSNASLSRLRTQLAQDKDLKPHELCGHKFIYTPGQGWYPYEFGWVHCWTQLKHTQNLFTVYNYLISYNITSLGLEYTIRSSLGLRCTKLFGERKGAWF
ncbi:hypothetical protein FPOA_13125 [Fusarium poae]|uniref:Uncharacterized protein n=1 Tax=Fusarium poae TaxID=36050 RepID=A0A1B8A6U6_FUSPO|nr:hypothetical protein FPOA_13125 [Fusarium poae]